MKRKMFFYFLVAVIVPAAAGAEIRSFSLSNAVETALRNNRQVQQAEADYLAARAQAGQSFADLWYPRINAGAGFQYVDQQTVTNSYLNSVKVVSNQTVMTYTFPVLVSNQMTNAFQDNYALTASVSKTLFAGMRYWNALAAKDLQTEIARLKMENKKRDIAADVTSAFYRLLMIRESVNLYKKLSDDVKERIDDNRAKFAQGMLSEFEEIRSEVQYENILPMLERLTNSEAEQKIALCAMLGIADADGTEFIGIFSDATNGMSVPEKNAAVTLALSNSLELRAADRALDVARLNKNIADGGKYPVVNAFFNYKFDYKKQNVNDELRGWGGGWNAGLQLDIPVEEWIPGSRTDQLTKEADAGIAKMEAARAELSEGLTARVKTLVLQTAESRSLAGKLYGTASKAQKAYDLARKLYLNGASTALALNDAESALVQVRIAWLQEYFNSADRWFSLKRLIGY